MKEQFVPYELALKLKELGFDEECLGFYTELENLVIKENVKRQDCSKDKCIAPLWQQAFDWFFNTQNLFQYIRVFNKRDFGFSVFTMYEDIGKALVYSSNYYETYEESRLACLEKLIELVE